MRCKLFKMENNGGKKRIEVFRFSKLLRCDCWLMSRCLAHISFTTFVLLLYFGPYFGGNVEIRCFLLSA